MWSARGCFITDSPGAPETGDHFVLAETDDKNLQVIIGSGFRFFILFPTDYTGSKSLVSPCYSQSRLHTQYLHMKTNIATSLLLCWGFPLKLQTDYVQQI